MIILKSETNVNCKHIHILSLCGMRKIHEYHTITLNCVRVDDTVSYKSLRFSHSRCENQADKLSV